MKRGVTNGPVVFTLGFIVAAGCGGTALAPPDDAVGRVVVSPLADTAAGVAGFQVDVTSAAGAVIASRLVPTTPPTTGENGGTLFIVPLGTHTVTATAMDAQAMPVASCLPASATATVRRGETAEVALVTRCQGRANGGLGVTVGTDYEPEFTAASYQPSRTVAPCQPVTVTVAAEDRDGDVISYRFQVVQSPAGAPAGVNFVLQPTTDRAAVLTSSIAGEFIIEAAACDALGCASLRLPVQVVSVTAGAGGAGGTTTPACSLSCDDGNPCTTDSWNTNGTCTHATVLDGAMCSGGNLRVKVLGINDFHGQLETGRRVANRPVGGAAVLASYLEAARAGIADQTIIVHAGDHVGASPPASALLQDEPSISFLNLLANPSCSATARLDPACNIVGTLGNHEFDEGRIELMRLLGGGNHAAGPFLEDPYGGARFPYVCANVVDEVTNQPILPPYVVKRIKGIPVAFIGAVLKDTPTVVTPTGVAGLRFLDEAQAINGYVPELRAAGVRAIIVTIHQGGTQTSYTGPTNPTPGVLAGADILGILDRLDSEVDVVVSGHSHAFTNSYVPNAAGKLFLVTQAFSAGTAYGDIDLLIDPDTRDVVWKTAQIVTTFGDVGPGLTPNPAVAALVAAAQTRVAPLVEEVVGVATNAISQTQNAAGESAMGDLIADAQRAAMQTDFAFMNPGGIRASLNAGDITWGELFTVQPFGNNLVRMNLTGAQIYQVLEQQWAGQPFPRIMQISGFDYTWDPALPVGSRVVEVRRAGVPIDLAAVYSITCNNFMAAGGDNFTTFVAGTARVGGPIDLDALVDYVEVHTPIDVVIDGRIRVP